MHKVGATPMPSPSGGAGYVVAAFPHRSPSSESLESSVAQTCHAAENGFPKQLEPNVVG
jgi:hypothetical protein